MSNGKVCHVATKDHNQNSNSSAWFGQQQYHHASMYVALQKLWSKSWAHLCGLNSSTSFSTFTIGVAASTSSVDSFSVCSFGCCFSCHSLLMLWYEQMYPHAIFENSQMGSAVKISVERHFLTAVLKFSFPLVYAIFWLYSCVLHPHKYSNPSPASS